MNLSVIERWYLIKYIYIDGVSDIVTLNILTGAYKGTEKNYTLGQLIITFMMPYDVFTCLTSLLELFRHKVAILWIKQIYLSLFSLLAKIKCKKHMYLYDV